GRLSAGWHRSPLAPARGMRLDRTPTEDTFMATKKKSKKKVSPIPKGYHSVTPALNQVDAMATIDFCKKAFGAKLRMKMPGANGKLMHAEIEIGDSIIMVSDAVMDPPRVASNFVYVPSVDKTIAKAVKAG